MYSVVANNSWDGRHLKGGFAFCVSLAAAGRFEEAENAVKTLEKLRGFDRYRFRFAAAIVQYMPSLALRIADAPNPPPQLLAGLLIKAGELEKAAQVIADAPMEGETYLLKSNIFALSPQEQLNALNGFLASYDLSKVSLIDAAKNVSVTNIKCTANTAVSTKNLPLVSILVTTCNTSSYIKHSLSSLLSQSYKNLEIIVADDYSTDDTVSEIAKIASKDSRVKFFANSVNVGTYAAKTLALRYAEGEFVVCHDSDDFAHPEWIERQVKPLLENSKFVASISQWIKINDEGRYWARNAYPLSRLNRTSLMFRKNIVLEKMGSWDIVRTGADSEFHARLKLVFGKKAVKYLRAPFIIGAYREDSLTTSLSYGYDSPVRQAYWEAWMRWHIDCLKDGKTPMMNIDKRPFPAPEEIITTINCC
jgi:hypothetical protein